jgi:allophanate hydrolase
MTAWIHKPASPAPSRNPDGPLGGLRMAVKDNIDVAGMPTTAACPSYAYTPEKSSPVVEALLNAGAVCVGKTNMDQFATGLVGTRSPYGACQNTINPEYISGGSSSGSAVTVANGEADFALGTDTAGSGRVPAAFNKLIGLKPTKGLLSTKGVVPACASLDCVSIFSQTVDMARRVFRACAPASTASFPGGPWRIGVADPASLFFDNDASAQAAYAQALKQWQDLGHTLVYIDPAPFLEAARLLYEGPFVAERYAAVGEFLDTEPADADPTVSAIIRGGAKHAAHTLFSAMDKLRALQARAADLWKQMDLLMLPTAPTCYTIADVQANPVKLNSNLGTYTNFVNLLDLCAIAVPCGTLASGIPTGVTLLAPAGQDEAMLHAAEVFLGEAEPHGINTVTLAVVGAHLQGMPLHHQLTDRHARFLRAARTAPEYKLFALAGTTPPKPGLKHVPEDGAAIEVELYELTPAAFGDFVANIPPPLGIGTLTLEDGSQTKGFICEPHALNNARDITHFGGWRAFMA